MAMRGTSVRGTPINRLGPTAGGTAGGREGYRSGGKPAGYSGTVNEQYEGDQGRRINPRSGTPYNSELGNPDEFQRVVSHDRYGRAIDDAAGDQANHLNNGNGVVLDGISRANAYDKTNAPAMDSPVPHGAPSFSGADMVAENRSHLGRGNESAASDVITEIGGVMSRGLLSTSTPHGEEREMLEDDDLRDFGPGGVVGRP